MHTVKTEILAFWHLLFYCREEANPITKCLIHWANPTGTFSALRDTTQYWRTTCQQNGVKDHILGSHLNLFAKWFSGRHFMKCCRTPFRIPALFSPFIHNYYLQTVKLIVQLIHLAHGFIPPHVKWPRIKRSFNISIKWMLFAIIWLTVKLMVLALESIFRIKWGVIRNTLKLNHLVYVNGKLDWNRFKCLCWRKLIKTNLESK